MGIRVYHLVLFFLPTLLSSQSNWKSYSLIDFNVAADFPKQTEKVDVEIQHAFSYKESIRCYNKKGRTTYQLTALNHPGIDKELPTEDFYKLFVRRWTKGSELQILKTEFLEINKRKVVRVISQDEISGFEIWQATKVGANFYVQSILNKKGDFDKKKVNAFLTSLSVKEKGEPRMYRMVDSIAAIACDMPIKPTKRRQTFETDEYGISVELVVNSQIAVDEYDHFNYLTLYRDNPAGVIFLGTDTTLNYYQEVYEKQFKTKSHNAKRTLINGQHTLELSFRLRGSELIMAIILRGNRAYILLIEELKRGDGLLEKKEQFFNSVQFLPHQISPIKRQVLRKDLSIGLPNTVLVDSSESYVHPYLNTYSYYSLDTLSGLGYTFDDYELSPFFTTENYDSLMLSDHDTLLTTEDLVSLSDTFFQGGRAWYLKSKVEDSDIVRHEVMFYRGPHYYSMMMIGGVEASKEKAWEYFHSFDFNRPEFTDEYIKIDHSDAIWTALDSRDSATVYAAKYTLNNTKVKRSDLPRVYGFLQRDFSYDTLTYPTMHRLMLRKLEEVREPATIPFLDRLIAENGDDSDFKKLILERLVQFKDVEAMEVFFKYANTFGRDVDVNEYGWGGFYELQDTIEVAAPFIDEWLALIDHPTLRYHALNALKKLNVDSLITPSEMGLILPPIIEEGNRIMVLHDSITKDSSVYDPSLFDLGIINEILATQSRNEPIDSLIQRQLEFKPVWALSSAVGAAIRLEIPVDTSILDTIFQDSKYNWYYLLKDLETFNKLASIPKKYLTQEAIVETFVRQYIEDDYGEITDFEIIDTRPLNKNGDRYIVYVYKFKYEYTGEFFQYGICTQPSEKSTFKITPDYFDYTYHDDKVLREKAVKELLVDFDKWEKKED